MSKRKRLFTEESINKLRSEGRGSGVGSEYLPWLTIQDVASMGRSTRLKGIKTNRQHEFLSDLERNYFYILEFSDEVIDIREQYPLQIEETILIAKELGTQHPQHPQTKEPIVMTTDFLITVKDGTNLARTIKLSDELMKPRVLEKFEIERVYWERNDVNWGIVTEKEIDQVLAKNISFVHNYFTLDQLDSLQDIDREVLENLVMTYIKRLLDADETIRHISNDFEKDFALLEGTGIAIFRYLLINKIVQVDMFEPINVNKKIKININPLGVHRELKII